jgi:uncharacterized protein YqhQ
MSVFVFIEEVEVSITQNVRLKFQSNKAILDHFVLLLLFLAFFDSNLFLKTNNSETRKEYVNELFDILTLVNYIWPVKVSAL